MFSSDLFFLSVIEMLRDNMHYFRPIFESSNDEFHRFLASGIDAFTYFRPKSVSDSISGNAYIHIGCDKHMRYLRWSMHAAKSLDGGVTQITFVVGDHTGTTRGLHDMDEVVNVFKGVISCAASRYKNNLSWKEPYNK